MSLVIRLAKTGKKGESKYRVVVKEKRDRRDGKAVEYLGWYEKRTTGEKKQLNTERINYWISVGAQTSPTVKKLLSRVNGMKNALTYIITSIVDNQDQVRIEEQENSGIIELSIFVAKEDVGKIIGKDGKVIRAIRNVMKIPAMKQNKKIQISINEAP